MKDGYRFDSGFLSAAETEYYRNRVVARLDLFHPVATKAGMNLPYHVVDGYQIRDELPDLFALVQGRLKDALEDAAGQPLAPLRDPKRAVRIQWYRRPGDGLRWHLDGGMYSALLTLINTNQGGTQAIPLSWSRYLKPIPYLLFPFPGLLARAPTTMLVSGPGDVLLMQGGALIHRGVNEQSQGERMVIVASFDPVGRRPTPLWDWVARRLNY